MTALVGILNLTPDSFSDGGRYASSEDALAQAAAMIQSGASVVDVGAESTRPGATPVGAEEEWNRLAPLLSPLLALCHRQGVALSIDTRHAATAERALACGVDWINDVAGVADPEMQRVLASSHCRIVLMHSLSVPADRAQVLPEEGDVVHALRSFFLGRIRELEYAGIDTDRLILDPGIGFGKTAHQSQQLLTRIEEFYHLGLPLMVGHSRKSFLGAGTASERDARTLEASRELIHRRVHYLRVHDVAAHAALMCTRPARAVAHA